MHAKNSSSCMHTPTTLTQTPTTLAQTPTTLAQTPTTLTQTPTPTTLTQTPKNESNQGTSTSPSPHAGAVSRPSG